ncbi:MAG: hypothetical protein HOC91_00815 [Nitrospinaceae bacterium]|jgi:hypothetical protein|nr:hypothetical protein [Nitrospinaceae bacterium]MBT3433894.1 hypothetical protein [Nitrospinaceae bacterium]MBT3823190.1 hypothetical protein [Nitrospinaceae bacterium]MBT4093088.1 hypothetical protein [Nitrospinaceae bacterium]MBT4429035.1 hypothetical protein [Nitrospinaceae bacterium]
MSDDLTTSGQQVFPEYPEIPGMIKREIQDINDEQMDATHLEKSWGAWSIRQQVSHIAYAHYRWFLDIWGVALFGDNPPREKTLLDTGGADRLLDPKRFHEKQDLLAAVQDASDLAWEILGNENLRSLREKVQSRHIPEDHQWSTGDGLKEWTENIVMKSHPRGFWRDENNSDLYHYDLEQTFRHVLWEAYAHLKTIQAHKQALGLSVQVDIPVVGYLNYLNWE